VFSILDGHSRNIPFPLLPNTGQSGASHLVDCQPAPGGGQFGRCIADRGILATDDKLTLFRAPSFGGFLGMGDKYFAIPWNAFHFNLKENRAVLNVDKKLLENAPGFDKDNWPNMVDSIWGTSIFKHYGYTPYWDEVSGTTSKTSHLA
jgi:hypothetical protein